MSDATDIRTAVVNDATLAVLIEGRIFPVVLPPDPALPAVTYYLVSQLTSVSQDSAQYRTPTWRFKIWSLIYADLVPIAVGLAAIFGDQARTPFPSSYIKYPASRTEDHETDTHRYWRAVDVVVGLAPAGAVAQ